MPSIEPEAYPVFYICMQRLLRKSFTMSVFAFATLHGIEDLFACTTFEQAGAAERAH